MAKILVIEDNADILEEVLTWLWLEDYEAIGAADGRIGIDQALTQAPDLILCDIMMPEKDGYRVLLELRTHLATALTPFIFMTAKQERVDIRYGMELGADDYITKPFSHEELLGAVRSRLARRDRFVQESDQRVSTMREHLLHMLPHELRTPLVGILGIGELLSQDAASLTPAEISDYAALITSSGQRLYRLVENHLLYAQLEIYAADPQKAARLDRTQVTAVAHVVYDTSEQVANLYERATALTLEVQPANLRIAKPDLSKIVYELLDNAFKFSKTPTPVQVSGKVQGDSYTLAITDQGHGLTPENLARLDAYAQFERSTHEQQGAGLGLAIVRRLAALASGAVQIESTVGIGTVVYVTLPMA